MRLARWLADCRRDTVLTLRLWTRRPAFAAAAVVTLALGLGAPTTIFSVVRAVLLRPLPYAQPDRIVSFRIESRTPRGQMIAFDALPVATALEWSATSAALSHVAVYMETARTTVTADGPVRLAGASATPNLFDLLRTSPAIGRTFESADRDARQVVLSFDAWQRYFAGGPNVGDTVVLDGVTHRLVGVMPRGFDFPTPETAFWIPVVLSTGGTRGMILPVIGRMRPEATVAAVAEEGRRLLADEGRRDESTLIVRTLQDQMVGPVRRTLWVLMAAVGVVSVIATVNISLLLLTQGATRAREFSLRLALGASRGRLMRQLSLEALLLAAAGGVAGLSFAELFLRALVRIAPPDVPRLHQATFDPQVLLFTGGLTVLATVVFAILSAGRIVAADLLRAATVAGSESRLYSTGTSRRRLHALAAAELALAVVLLVGAGLLLRSFVGLILLDQGFDTRGAVAVQITLPSARYPSPDARMAFHERLLASLRQRPDVSHAGMATSMPNRQPAARFGYDPAGVDPLAQPGAENIAAVYVMSEDFLEAMGLRLLAGRTFTAADAGGAEPVMVISDELARVHFGAGEAVGRMLYSGSGTRRVIGVVGTIRPADAAGLQYNPSAYLPVRQQVSIFRIFASATIIARGARPETLAGEIRSLVRSLDPELAPFNVRTLDAEVSALVAGSRFSATVLALFAAVALVMAAVGVYGVAAYSTGRRTREIGVRVALGATRAQILRLILKDGLIVVSVGLASGLAAAVWLARTLTGLLHEVTPADPVALVSVALLLSAIGLTAVYVPAARAARLNPLVALREE